MFLFCKSVHCHYGIFCGDKNVDFVIIKFLLTKFMATKGTFLGPQGYCILKCIIYLAMLFGFKKHIWLWYFEMVAELAVGVWNGGKFVYSMCGHGDYFCYKHAYKVDFVVTCEIAQTKVQTHTHTHTSL
jgi:hypothetical protein